MIQKILLAVSGLGHAEEMLKTFADLPSVQKSKVTVLHVVPPQTSAENMTAKWEEGGKILANAIQYLNLDPSLVSSILRQGEPKDVVCQVADEMDADLIIMGSRGLKRLQSILSNSVSQYVFQLSSRPMLLVKDDIYIKKINRIMVAMDASETAKYCLKLALFLLKDLKGAELLLANINPDGQSKSGKAELTPEQNPILAVAIAEAKKYGVSTRCVVSTGTSGQDGNITGSGRAGREICRLADDSNVDLLVIGSPDRRPSIAKNFVDLDRLLGSSLSDYVRVNATCPVLLARTDAA
ncbi:universal stress protein [Brunnivagina elsteri]|uniref:Universal stress protein UspA n=1 Tax=Brunnivagina elsteri CCALA 953 TaxID=987040 RepID=A0A2A2TDH2_9CYAN|nr:universal stress protein [Calothrix elsteri]PAX51794.1 universal stress protein UspA [Calothrix elsteri CCALA 953]